MGDNYCRLCMEEDDLNQMDSTVLPFLNKQFSIEIENDDLSREICKTCLTFVSQWIAFEKKICCFREKGNKTQKLLQKIVKRKDVKDSEVTNQLNPHVVVNNGVAVKFRAPAETEIENLTDTNLENELISKIIKSIDLNEVESVAAEINPINAENTWCKVCKIKIPDHSKYIRHVKSSAHKFKSYIVSKYAEPNIFDYYMIGYTCNICKNVYTSKTVLSAHSKKDHNFSQNKNKIKPDTLIKKVKSNGGEDSRKDVTESGISIKTEPNTENPSKQHICKICHKCFGFAESLSRHSRKHHNLNYCALCGFTTLNNRTFSTHLREHYHLTYLQRVCSTCFKVCDSYVDLNQHRAEYHTVKQACSICNESFANTTLLKKHKRDVHRAQNEDPLTEKPLKCKRCNRSFLTLLVLEKHQCTAMKFPCLKNCGRRFDTYSKMERHSVKCNTGNTIYSCTSCKKILKTLNSLKTHMMKCSATSSTSSTSTDSKTLFIDLESTKSNEQPAKIPESCLLVQQDRIASISQNPDFDSTEICSQKETKTDISKELAQVNSFTCTKCHKSISIDDLKDHVKKCCKVTTKKAERSKSALKRMAKREARIKIKIKKQKKSKLKKKEKKQLKLIAAKTFQTPSRSIACKLCGLVFKNDEFLKQHELITHGPLADKIAQNTIRNPDVNHTASTKKKLQPSTENRFHGSEVLQTVSNRENSKEKEQFSSLQKSPSSFSKQTVMPNDRSTPAQQSSSSHRSTSSLSKQTSMQNEGSTPPQQCSSSHRSTSLSSKQSVMQNERSTPHQQCSSSHRSNSSFSKQSLMQNERSTPPQQCSSSHRSNSSFSKQSLMQNERSTPQQCSSSHRSNSSSSKQTVMQNKSSTLPQQSSSSHRSTSSSSKQTVMQNENSTPPQQSSSSQKSTAVSFIPLQLASESRPETRQNYPLSSKWELVHKTPNQSYKSRQKPYSEHSPHHFNNRFSPGFENQNSRKHTTSTPKLLKPDYLTKNDKQQVTLTAHNSPCKICRNPDEHLYCGPCGRCFTTNQVQYLNHVKMKHS